jgi:transcriptional regulator PpsR
VRLLLADGEREVAVAASQFRDEHGLRWLIRLTPCDGARPGSGEGRQALLSWLENAPDGYVVTSADGIIETANAAFLRMAELAGESQARGCPLVRWLGRSAIDFGVLIAGLRHRGSVDLFATTLRGQQGLLTSVEISAVVMTDEDRPLFGFAIRDTTRRGSHGADAAPLQTGEDLQDSIGRVPLKDLVRQAGERMERACIEAALVLTLGNRTWAAQTLGLSCQSLYAKMRHHGLADLVGEAGG